MLGRELKMADSSGPRGIERARDFARERLRLVGAEGDAVEIGGQRRPEGDLGGHVVGGGVLADGDDAHDVRVVDERAAPRRVEHLARIRVAGVQREDAQRGPEQRVDRVPRSNAGIRRLLGEGLGEPVAAGDHLTGLGEAIHDTPFVDTRENS